MELGIVKNDVITELRSQLYYNELEIGRIAQSNTVNHQERIKDIVRLTRSNASILESLKLVEIYFPAKKEVSQAPAADVQAQ